MASPGHPTILRIVAAGVVLKPCRVGRPLSAVSDETAGRDFPAGSDAWRLLSALALRDGFSISHGQTETVVCYRGYRIGGIDRKKAHWFVSSSFGVTPIDIFLKAMRFELRSRPYADRAHSWYELEGSRVSEFDHTISELAGIIDVRLGQPIT